MTIFRCFLVIFMIINTITAWAAKDCGGRDWLGIPKDQACQRCSLNGFDMNNNCKANGIPAPGSNIGIAAITFTFTPQKNPFAPPKYSYYMNYSYCNQSNWPWNIDDCNDTTHFPRESMDVTKIASSLQDCIDTPQKYLQSFQNIKELDQKICLVKVQRGSVKNYARDFPLNDTTDNFQHAVCAFLINTKESIGCVPYPLLPGPPPFTKGLVPYISFFVPKILDYSVFDRDTSFHKPLSVINKVRGSKTLSNSTIKIDKLYLGQNEKCDEENMKGFCATIVQGKPDQVLVTQNGNEIGSYARPAIEQKPAKLSFFPCYHTYNDQYKNAYQAIYPFSMNANVGDIIGKTQNNNPIYLGQNYLPSLDPKTVGDILQTECDLCINAAMQNQNDWPNNIYSNGYKLNASTQIKECILNSNIFIQKMSLLDQVGGEITYLAANPCKDKPTNNPAPLRVNMFNTDEQQNQTCNGQPVIFNYSYESDTGNLGNYLVKIKPVIPAFDKDNEAKFFRLSLLSKNGNCSTYQEDLNGSVFITPAGKRNRDKCVKDPNDNVNFFSMCGQQTSDALKSVCPGTYDGPDPNNTLPDKICMMSADNWDFISGRYIDGITKNLNGDSKIVPKMACTFLPACKNLGDTPIKNIGNAIWNEDQIPYGERTNGKCQEITDSNASDNKSKYTYRYEIGSYEIIVENIQGDEDQKNAIKDALNTIKQNSLNKTYISEYDIKTNINIWTAYSNNKNIFKCKRIYPNAQCIGGIYGNLKQDTSCVSVQDNGTPITCIEIK